MSKMCCPNCKESGKISTYDNESLDNSCTKTDGNYFLDKEIYAMAKCHGCGFTFRIQGDITWRTPTLNDEIK